MTRRKDGANGMEVGKKLLMIDDDKNLVDVFRLVCTAKGYEFHAAYSAAEGLQKVLEVGPDVIILDVIMEDFVAGFRVLSELRTPGPGSQFARYSKVPIVMLTSVTSRTHVDFSERVGTALLPVDAFVEKPVKPADLLAILDKILSRSESTTSAAAQEG
jgi:two-component system response regulator MprA